MGSTVENYLWNPPEFDVGTSGILLSDRIEYYAGLVELVRPYYPEDLRPASYDLRVGAAYYIEDALKTLAADGVIEIPANGLVYIQSAQWLNIPYYIVARYSLRVKQVLRGLLVDNGLHVDPGYHGYLWVPVHNLTDETRILRRGEPFLSMEFTKTTPFLPDKAASFKTEADLVRSSPNLKGVWGSRAVLFVDKIEKLNQSKSPIDLWLPDERHRSSMLGVERNLVALQTEMVQFKRTQTDGLAEHKTGVDQRVEVLSSRFRRYSSFGVLAAIAIISGIYAWWTNQYTAVYRLAAEAQQSAKAAAADVGERDRILKLENELRQLKQELIISRTSLRKARKN